MSKTSVSKSPYQFECVLCQGNFSEAQTVTTCLKCHGALDVKYHAAPKIALKNLPSDGFEFLRAIQRLPLNGQALVSLGEGNTPLIHAKKLGQKFGLSQLYLKYEGANPTGVFKDRGSALEITKALELNAKAVCCASTGNMAASVAAYAAKAGIPCYVLIPEKTPLGKLAQAIAYGAHTIKIRGTYVDCVRMATEMSKKHRFYLAGDYAFRLEGQKTVAYELFRQLENEVPDWIVSPIGCGTHLSGIFKGFLELKEVGLTNALPHLLGVQPETVPTIVRAFRKKKARFVPVANPVSLASAVAIGVPQDDVKVLRALYDSRGNVLTCSEEEILAAQRLLGTEEALFVEPSAALPVAILAQAVQKKIFARTEKIVLFITGAGLKDPQSILLSSMDSPILEPTIAELQRYFSSGFAPQGQQKGFFGREAALWRKVPVRSELEKTLRARFGLRLPPETLEHLLLILKEFHEKSSAIRHGDLKYALENVLKTAIGIPKKLNILDFSVQVSQHAQPQAWAKVDFSGKTFLQKAKGVGPVDAVIRAIQKGIREEDTLHARLFDYAVEINTKGTDAVVEVRLGLRAQDGVEVVGEAVSPDIIVASIQAFANAYNLLSWKTLTASLHVE